MYGSGPGRFNVTGAGDFQTNSQRVRRANHRNCSGALRQHLSGKQLASHGTRSTTIPPDLNQTVKAAEAAGGRTTQYADSRPRRRSSCGGRPTHKYVTRSLIDDLSALQQHSGTARRCRTAGIPLQRNCPPLRFDFAIQNSQR